MSSFRNRSPEPGSLYSIPSKEKKSGTFSPSKHRQNSTAHPDDTKQGHLRVFSETSVPSSLQTGLPNGRSAGRDTEESSGSGINGTDTSPQDQYSEAGRNWFWNGLTRNASLNYPNRHANGLQALDEDGPAPEAFEQRAARDDVIEEERSIDLESPRAAAFDAQNPPTTGLTRARSTTQMHDLREQMQDLKGKISTLKQRAKEDTLKRRSLQSLRTPSPFTAADQWYGGTPSPETVEREMASGAGSIQGAQMPLTPESHVKDMPQDSGHASPEEPHAKGGEELQNGEVILVSGPGQHQEDSTAASIFPGDGVTPVGSVPSQKERLVLVDESLPDEDVPDDDTAGVTEENSPTEADAEDYADAHEDNPYEDQDFHDTSTSPIVTRHEDREDAFDYEHYILTSAMGSYTGIGARRSSSNRKRSNSLSSESSVETTKPRNSTGSNTKYEDPHLINGRHGRQDSIDSISTTNSFATANEDNESDPSPDERTAQKPTPISWRPEPPSKHKPNGSNESAPDRLQTNGLQKMSSKTHIASAQKGYVNNFSRKSPPVPSERNAPAQPPDLLTVLATTHSWQEGAPPLHLDLGERDIELLERLVKSLAKVCSQVHTLGPEGSKYEARVFRRKLDAARRVLDGEMNGEAF